MGLIFHCRQAEDEGEKHSAVTVCREVSRVMWEAGEAAL
jgi:hypothetical protein